MAFENSQGITFTFDGKQYTATSISVSRSRGEFDVSSTDIPSGRARRLRAGKLNLVDIKVDWIGETLPTLRATRPFAFTGTNIGYGRFSGGSAICTSYSITANAGDVLKGSATFRVSKD